MCERQRFNPGSRKDGWRRRSIRTASEQVTSLRRKPFGHFTLSISATSLRRRESQVWRCSRPSTTTALCQNIPLARNSLPSAGISANGKPMRKARRKTANPMRKMRSKELYTVGTHQKPFCSLTLVDMPRSSRMASSHNCMVRSSLLGTPSCQRNSVV